jgi:8-oxo-dGTP pyrophosphatase MutT (NUDIX family)
MPEGKPEWLVPHGRPWEIRRSRPVYDNPWIGLTEHEATAPSGRHAPVYGVVHFKNLAVAVLPLHEDGTVTMVGQNRLPAADYSWELPEGGVPFDEDPLEGARRELREETGLEAPTGAPSCRTCSCRTPPPTSAPWASGAGPRPGESEPDETEDLALARVPFGEALAAAVAGHTPDVLTVVMLLRAHHMAAAGELPDELARLMLGSPD